MTVHTESLAVFAILRAPPLCAQEAGHRLSLLCDGAGTANRHSTAHAYSLNNSGGSSGGFATSQRSVGFEDQLQLWVEGATSKARLPRTLLPRIHGGNEGWFDVKDVHLSDTEITGTVAVSVLNHPKLVLDRIAGTIGLDGGSGHFNGRCQKFDPENTKRAF